MKSLPLLNGRTANPSEASKRPVALSIMGSSSTRQTISGEGCSLGVLRICATGLFSMWEVAIMPHIRSRPVSRVVDLSLMDLSLMRAPKCEPDHSLACFLGDTNPRDYPKMNVTGDTRNHRWLRCAAKANTLADVF